MIFFKSDVITSISLNSRPIFRGRSSESPIFSVSSCDHFTSSVVADERTHEKAGS
jgi:hypothetical protein